jgi:purine-nucleoside phosphorylase
MTPRLASFERALPQGVARPQVALVLGSGMGPVTERLSGVEVVPFTDLPGLPVPSVAGHAGTVKIGAWAGLRVLVFEGRLHFYEGHAWRQVVEPVHLAAFLGARVLVLTNAAGGIDPALGPGALMAIRDHLEWTYPYWWRRPGPGGLSGSRASPYSPRLLGLLREAAMELGLPLSEGIYAAVPGPCYETPAEIRALQIWGAAAVGMSTAREIEAGHARGLECAALSCITNRAAGLDPGRLDHQEVLTTASASCTRLGNLLEAFLGKLYVIAQR